METIKVKRVYNLLILDESGSMQSIKQPIINGFNEIIQSIRNASGSDADLKQWISFYSFNGKGIKEQISLSAAEQLKELNDSRYQPDDVTPLYDAIGYACNNLRFSIENEKDYLVLVTILTDGAENSSKEYNLDAIVKLITELKGRGWVFTYIGANHDVERVAFSLNISSSIQFESNLSSVNNYILKEKNARSVFYSKIKSGKKENLDKGYFNDENNNK